MSLNEKNREQKSRQRVVEIQQMFGEELSDLVQPHRVLLHEGTVTMTAKRTVSLYLFNDIIVIGHMEGSQRKVLEQHSLDTVWVVHTTTVNIDDDVAMDEESKDFLDFLSGADDEFVFELLWPGTKFSFGCKTKEDCVKWAAAISGAIHDFTNKVPKAAHSRGQHKLYRDKSGVWELTGIFLIFASAAN